MQQVTIEFKKVYEHDMDLLIMEEFISDRKFARIFLDKLKLSDDYRVCKAFHSLADSDGESDITLILQYSNRKIALLIEDKIDAQTMPDQSNRYYRRGDNAVSRGEYDDYYVLLAAPDDYHAEHMNDSNAAYEHRVRYEELWNYFDGKVDARSAFKKAMIDRAIREKKAGYQVREVEAVTEFWKKLRKFCKEEYPRLSMVGEDSPKGAAASWPEFRTSLGNIKVIYKAQKGYVDLEFPTYGNRTADLYAIIGDRMHPSMQIWQTGKSASVRIENEKWKVAFSREFEPCVSIISEVLQAVSLLCEFASKLNYSEIY